MVCARLRFVLSASHASSASRTLGPTNTTHMELQMRTLLLLSAVAILGACSDNQSTAPTASRSPNRSAAGDVSPSNPGSVGGQARPQDQVGFTTVTTVTGTTADLNNNGLISNTSTATCPAGTHAIAGGYTVNFG